MAHGTQGKGAARLGPDEWKTHVKGDDYDFTEVEIEGVVSSSHQHMVVVRDLRRHQFFFQAWLGSGGELIERTLVVIRMIPLQAEWSTDYQTHSVHRLLVYLSKRRMEALLIGSSDQPASSTAFSRYTTALVRALPGGGEVELYSKGHWMQGDVAWKERSVDIYVWLDPNCTTPSPRQLALLDLLWSDLGSWEQRARTRINSDLLAWFNDEWLGDEPEHDEQRFNARLKLTGLHILGSAEDEFVLHFHAGEMFGDHNVRVDGSLKEGFVSAEIQ